MLQNGHIVIPQRDVRNPKKCIVHWSSPEAILGNRSASRDGPQKLEIKIEVSWMKWSISRNIKCSCNPNYLVSIFGDLSIPTQCFESRSDHNNVFCIHLVRWTEARCTLVCRDLCLKFVCWKCVVVTTTSIYPILHFGTFWLRSVGRCVCVNLTQREFGSLCFEISVWLREKCWWVDSPFHKLILYSL